MKDAFIGLLSALATLGLSHAAAHADIVVDVGAGYINEQAGQLGGGVAGHCTTCLGQGYNVGLATFLVPEPRHGTFPVRSYLILRNATFHFEQGPTALLRIDSFPANFFAVAGSSSYDREYEIDAARPADLVLELGLYPPDDGESWDFAFGLHESLTSYGIGDPDQYFTYDSARLYVDGLSVPEPATWINLTLAFALMGSALRAQRWSSGLGPSG